MPVILCTLVLHLYSHSIASRCVLILICYDDRQSFELLSDRQIIIHAKNHRQCMDITIFAMNENDHS